MPIYDGECPVHGLKENVWGKMNDNLQCPECGMVMKRLITATRIIPDWKPYMEENMGDKPILITSRQHYYRELKERGLHNINDTRG